ncbi:MAG: hypothetical protein DRI79_07835 [Chloroflexi bacterium]|nr:MAG: hypothetical protein DRI79_07835 [Chloroflexota bacterium]
MSKKNPSLCLAILGLVASILACNFPGQGIPTPPASPPIETPHVTATSPPQETAPPPPTETLQETAPSPTETLPSTPTQWFPPTNTPTSEITPPAVTPTSTTPASAGPLNFSVPTALDHWQPLPNGEYECKIILHITGGAPPYTVHHDVDVFTTWETDPEIVFKAHGCGAIVHTIQVKSADGQTVSQGYWIPVPWCESEE